MAMVASATRDTSYLLTALEFREREKEREGALLFAHTGISLVVVSKSTPWGCCYLMIRNVRLIRYPRGRTVPTTVDDDDDDDTDESLLTAFKQSGGTTSRSKP
jgi:hypothetical protein